jgi:N6-L-threonylcarbamoyladenine synthase
VDDRPVVLALETSCDETAAAVLKGAGGAVAERVFSQAARHAEFGGVVPEVASRSHLEAVPAVVGGALEEAGLRLDGVDVFAATTGPGLAPALLVGAGVARGMAMGGGRPFRPVNHLEAHLLSPFFGQREIPPHTAMVVSGGHTLLFDVAGFGSYRLLGRTLDDAAGEAFDKVAKLLGLGYPGGPAIERLAASGNPSAVRFPRGMMNSPSLDFSFSGLKTSVRVFLEKDGGRTPLPDICASFQEAVVEVLAARLLRAAREHGRQIATLSGGVSSNRALVERARKTLDSAGIALHVASPGLRTDNAAMVAHAAALQHIHGRIEKTTHDIRPNFDPSNFP